MKYMLIFLLIHYITNFDQKPPNVFLIFIKEVSFEFSTPVQLNLISNDTVLSKTKQLYQSRNVLLSCDNQCVKCNNNNCVKCKKGYFLYKSSCYESCPYDTYADNYSFTCKEMSNSPVYLKAYTTSICLNSCGKEFSDCSCNDECRFKGNCCSDYNSCELIESHPINKDCLLDNCKLCNGESCLQCQDNYYFYNNKCYLGCSSLQTKIDINRLCINRCNVENCENCENDLCQKCLNGYFLYNNKCLKECPYDTKANKIDFTCQSKNVFSFYWVFPSTSSCNKNCGKEFQECSCRVDCVRKGNCCDDFEKECPLELHKEDCMLCDKCNKGNCNKCSENAFASNHNVCICKDGYVFNEILNICEKVIHHEVYLEPLVIPNDQIIQENHQIKANNDKFLKNLKEFKEVKPKIDFNKTNVYLNKTKNETYTNKPKLIKKPENFDKINKRNETKPNNTNFKTNKTKNSDINDVIRKKKQIKIKVLKKNKTVKNSYNFADELKKHFNEMIKTVLSKQIPNYFNTDKFTNHKEEKPITQKLTGNITLNDLKGNKDTKIENTQSLVKSSNIVNSSKQSNKNSYNNLSKISKSGNVNKNSNSGSLNSDPNLNKSSRFSFNPFNNFRIQPMKPMNTLYQNILKLGDKTDNTQIGIGTNKIEEFLLKSKDIMNSKNMNILKKRKS